MRYRTFVILMVSGVAQGHSRLLKAAQGRSRGQTYMYKVPINRTAEVAVNHNQRWGPVEELFEFIFGL